MRDDAGRVVNAFTVDVEDWFCVHNMEGVLVREQWDNYESRVERNTLRLLDLLGRHGMEATFFVLGWVAERFPDLVAEMERRGHEIATHGHSHRLLTGLTPEEFRADLGESLKALSRCTRKPVLGFRAPSFSVTRKTWWAVEILREMGLRYDSSIFPAGFHPDYGIADAEMKIARLENGLIEVPMSCARWLGQKIPCSGGGYFRMYPYLLTRKLMESCQQENRPVIFYVHPWEIDPEQPRIALPWMKRLRHYNHLEQTEERLEKMLTDFSFTSIRRLLEARGYLVEEGASKAVES